MKRLWRKAVPATPIRMDRGALARADRRLRRLLDREFARSARRAGQLLACEPGCSECCAGPFPITRLDVWRLRRGLQRLAGENRGVAEAVMHRAGRATRVLARDYPGDGTTGRLRAGQETLDRFFERHAGLVCPALDPTSGRCDLYDWRPVSCRTYGPPVRFDRKDAPPCRLCFRDAAADTIERCRMEPDREGLEEAILGGLGVRSGEDWETLIAFALAGGSFDVAE